MATTLVTAPPSRAFSDNPIWVRIETDESVTGAATLKLEFSGSGPASGNTLRIQWAGNDLLFTVSATNGETALDLPVKGAETLAEYAALVAARFYENEVINTYFRAELLGTSVTLVQRLLEPVDITATSSLANTTVTVTDVTTLTTPDALRALLQVWSDTGSLATDTLLLSQHAPYPLPDTVVALDIRAAFASLGPVIPSEGTINPIIPPTTQPFAQASGAYTRYYLRHGDKSGIPAVAQGLTRSSTYTAVYGHQSAESLHLVTNPLRHAYARRDKATFVKPVTPTQPDWLYWVAPSGVTSVYIQCTIYWSDGTELAYNPWGTTGVTVVPGEMYWFPSGFRQNKLHTVAPGGGTDPDAYATGFRTQIRRTDGGLLIGEHGITHTLYQGPDWDAFYLLFDNGVGGMETVAMRGKYNDKYKTTSEEHVRNRQYGWTVQQGDFGAFAHEGRSEWEVNTGWLSDNYYLDHLRQLPLAQQVFLVDVVNRKLRRVIVAPGEIQTNEADSTLFAQSFTIRAGWSDQAANL